MGAIQAKKFGDKYVLLDRIATGGMAEVYRGKLTGVKGFEKLLAIKKMLPQLTREKEMVDYFIDEAKLAALLQHENIIHIYDFGSLDGSYFIAMEYLFGKDLNSIINRSREKKLPIRIENVLLIASQICEGMEYAHNLEDLHGKPLNIIHRDITPHNIFITYDGKVKIIDFGIAKTTIQSTQTKIGLVKGKIAYMSPEQVEGQVLDHRSDIFTIGILIYEMVTNTRLYQGNTMQVIQKAINAKYEPLENFAPNLHPQLYEIIQRALIKDPAKRYQSCGEMLKEIQNCLYNMTFRPNAKQLAAYVISLFDTEYQKEKEAAVMAMDSNLTDELVDGNTIIIDKTDEKIKVPSDSDETVFIHEENRIPKDLNAADTAPFSKRKGSIINWKKQIGLASIILVLISCACLFIFYPDPPGHAPENNLKKNAAIKTAELNHNKAKEPTSPREIEKDSKPKSQEVVIVHPIESVKTTDLSSQRDNTPPGDIKTIDSPKSQEVAIVHQNETVKTIDLSTPKDKEKAPQNDITKPIAPEVSLQIDSLLEKAETCMKAKKLTTPVDDCALKYYDAILKIDAYNAPGRKGIELIGAQYALWADQALSNFKIEKAKRLVNKGLSVSPENKRLLALQKELKQHKSEVIIKRVDRNLKQVFKKIFE